MKNVLELIVTSLVENKDAVSIEEINREKYIEYRVKVDSDDMGKIIGKQGRIAKSIRTVMKSVAGRERKRVSVEFVED